MIFDEHMTYIKYMDFFNKFKTLFEVPEGLSVPRSRLRLDNELFVEKVYQGTVQQQYSLNSKLRQLKKDYSSFESQLNEVAVMRKTPKRSLSRKQRTQEPSLTIKNNENRQLQQIKSQSLNNNRLLDLQREKQRILADSIKRESWLKDEHNNILKHSEIDHIFKNKLNSIYELDDIKTNVLPKPPKNESYSHEQQQNRNNFQIKNRGRRNTEEKSPNQQRKKERGGDTAISRRQKAKDTLQFRRKKLQQLLKTLW